jgi:curved DNA-binding protein CbpA
MQNDYYKILGVPKDATIKQIKKIYKSLSRCYHPDVNDLSNANEKMEEINEAYRALSNPHERQSHDDDISSVKSYVQPRLNINLSKIKITATTSYSDYDGLSHTTYVSNLRCY